MNSSLKQNLGRIFALCLLGMAMAGGLFAQETTTSITDGEGTKNVKVESGEVVYVSGHDLVVKKDDGKIVHFANIDVFQPAEKSVPMACDPNVSGFPNSCCTFNSAYTAVQS